jgi:hypothetical protein
MSFLRLPALAARVTPPLLKRNLARRARRGTLQPHRLLSLPKE